MRRSFEPVWLASAVIALAPALGGGCGAAEAVGGGSIAPTGPGGPGSGAPPAACHDIYSQDLLPTFELEIAREHLSAMRAEWRALRYGMPVTPGADPTPYHPAVFRHEGEQIDDAMVRIKSVSVTRDDVREGKLQVVISFNEIDPEGRFRGLRKLDIDMPGDDHSFLRARLASAFFRDLGVPVQCVNSARLLVNGNSYGVYANLERFTKDFVRRAFPDGSSGTLWHNAVEAETNEETADRSAVDALNAVTDLGSFEATADVPAALLAWAGEALPPSHDGYWRGASGDFYVYEHPKRRFVWIPADIDSDFDAAPVDADPVYYWRQRGYEPGKHYFMVISDGAARGRFVAALERARAAYDVGKLQGLIDQWSAQIAGAAAEEMMGGPTLDEHSRAVVRLRNFVAERAAFVDRWLACDKATPAGACP
jgi:hypothetical protein